MNRKIFILGIIIPTMLSLLGAFSVGALSPLQATPTPTRDIRTPPPPPTAFVPSIQNNYNFTCPTGLPEGYGEIDPDPAWSAICAKCLPTPEPYPTYSPDMELSENEYSISCLDGGFNCRQVSPDTIELSASSDSMLLAAEQAFMLHEDSDLYVGYRFRQYALRSLHDGLIYQHPTYLGVDGGTSLYNDLQGDRDIDLQYSQSSANTAGIHRLYAFVNEGSSDLVQQFNCSKIYISTINENPYPAGGCVSGDPCNVELVGGDIVVVRYNTWGQDLSCIPWYNGLKCSLNYSKISGLGGLQYYPSVLVRNTSVYSGPIYMFAEGIADGYFMYQHPLLTDGVGPCSSGYIWSSGSPAIGTGIPASYSCVTSTDINGYRQFDMGVSTNGGYVSSSFILQFIIMPMPVIREECLGYSTSGNEEISGSYCAIVQPRREDIILDYKIFTPTGDSLCSTIPYFSIVDFVPDWLEAILSPQPIWSLIFDVAFPASRICFVEYQWARQFVLGVYLPIAELGFIILSVWFLYRISKK